MSQPSTDSATSDLEALTVLDDLQRQIDELRAELNQLAAGGGEDGR